MQILTPEQAKDFRWDIFDITKVWPHGEVPPIKIGKLVLNRNPANYFAEVEQAAFCPGNVVPGIAISPDKMLQARVFSYHDTHIHRLGPNYHLIPVNAPKERRGEQLPAGRVHAGGRQRRGRPQLLAQQLRRSGAGPRL